VDIDGGIFSYSGTAWSNLFYAPEALVGVSIGTNGNAFVAGSSSVILRASTADSFATWTTITPTSNSGNFLYDISTYDGTNVIAVGAEGTIYYSADSGDTWSLASSGGTKTIYCISHASANFAMIAGDTGYLAKTSDYGATWTTLTAFASTYTARYHAISVLTSQNAFVVASPSNSASGGLIYRTLDGGTTWQLQQTTTSALYSVSVYSLLHGVVGAAPGTAILTLVPGKTCFHIFVCNRVHYLFTACLGVIRPYGSAFSPTDKSTFWTAIQTAYGPA
jgi:photosystem II stability/assembly factor-like uncharacterized protein